MKRFLRYGAIAVLVLILVISVSFDSLLRTGVEAGGSAALQTDVALGSADLSLFGGRVVLEELEIANPPGFTSERAFRVEAVDAAVSVGSLLGGTVQVDHIVIDSPEITLEIATGGSNLGKLLASIQGPGDAGSGEDVSMPGDKDGESRRMEIGLVRIVTPRVVVAQSIIGESSTSLTLDTIELRNVGADRGRATTTLPELIEHVLAAILAEVSRHGDLPREVAVILDSDLRSLPFPQIFQQFGDLPGALSKGLEKGLKDVRKEASNALEKGVRDLFGKPKKDR